MKKHISALSVMLVLALFLFLSGCGSSAGIENNDAQATSAPSAETEATETEENGTAGEKEAAGNRVLVVYFSRTGEQYGVGVIEEGNTAIVAKMIIEATGADSFEIVPADDHYPMTYDELLEVAKQEQNENARPAYQGTVIDLSRYDTVFIGAPVWWGDWPMICYTFFENEDLSGKTLYPFSTHAGSGLSGFDRKLASACPGSTVGEGLAVAGTDCQNKKDSVRGKVSNWLSDLGF